MCSLQYQTHFTVHTLLSACVQETISEAGLKFCNSYILMQLRVIGDDDTSSWLWTCVGQSTLFSQTSAYYLLYFITTLVCLVWNQLLMWWWPACLCFAAVWVCVCRLTRWLGFIFLLLCHHLAYTYQMVVYIHTVIVNTLT